MNIDTIITIAIIGFFLLRAFHKSKRAAQKKRRPLPSSVFTMPEKEAEPTFREEFEIPRAETRQSPQFVTSTNEETPKNDSYFTYETIEPEIGGDDHVRDNSFHDDVEKIVQNIDNETEKMSQITFEKEDLIKGIIYSEILKRPYN